MENRIPLGNLTPRAKVHGLGKQGNVICLPSNASMSSSSRPEMSRAFPSWISPGACSQVSRILPQSTACHSLSRTPLAIGETPHSTRKPQESPCQWPLSWASCLVLFVPYPLAQRISINIPCLLEQKLTQVHCVLCTYLSSHVTRTSGLFAFNKELILQRSTPS